MTRTLLIFPILLLLLSACNDNEEPDNSVLEQPPYAGITEEIKASPKNDVLYFKRGELLQKSNLPVLALADYKKAWSLKQDEEYAMKAATLIRERSADSAVIFLQSAIEQLPGSVLLHVGLAKAYEISGKTKQAFTVYDTLLKWFPKEASLWMLKADLLEKVDDSIQVLPTLEMAHRLDPLNKQIGYNLAYQYAEIGSAKTIALADSLIAQDTLGIEAEPYYIKGVYYSGIKQNQKAIEWFDKTIQHDQRHLNAFIEKGKIYFDEKKYDLAMKTFQLANRVSPAFADAYYWIGRCQEVAGQKEDAKLNYEKAYSLDKTFTEAKEAAAKLN